MTRRHTQVFIGLTAAVAAATGGIFLPSGSVSAASRTYQVVSVTDGDTIKVNYNGAIKSVRLIGVDTPEVNSRANTKKGCYATQAKNYLTRKLQGKYVSLVSDSLSGDKDYYGRLLRYVYLGSEDVNRSLVAGGYGREYKYYYNSYHRRTSYLSAQTAAKNSRKGLWNLSVCPMNT